MAMTTSEIITYYSKLLILQYLGKPRAVDTVKAFVTPAVMDQLPLAVQDAFSVETAVGDQLDILGTIVGVSRNTNTFTGLVTLDDDDFRLLIKMKIVQNNAGSSLYDIQALIALFFPDALRVFDYANMTMSYFFEATIGSEELAEVFVRLGLLPKPMGVQLASLIYAVGIDNFFGFRTYAHTAPLSVGFRSYSTDNGGKFLSYTDAITG